ncbi:hypothetical protein EJ110_NYTH41429 [Nymphaea thermarum]|nr:hypothetical protein EJ110_NYTH41429 [Nymphaea thermarum]
MENSDLFRLATDRAAWSGYKERETVHQLTMLPSSSEAATDVAESSHRGRGKAALHSVQTKPSQVDPSPGQEGGVGGVKQPGQAEKEVTIKLGVGAEGGAGEIATALSEVSDVQEGGSSSVLVKSTHVAEVEKDNSTHEEQPSAELEVHAIERMVHIKNEVLRIRQEMSDYKRELSKLSELEEIKEMIRAMSSNQEANQRSNHGPPPPPPPIVDKGKGVLGGPPNADPAPLHLQAGPSWPPPTWNYDSSGGNNGHHAGHHDHNRGHQNYQGGGHHSYPGGQHSSSLDWETREPYGPHTSQYGTRWLKHKESVHDWEEFKEALLLRFGESAYVDYDIELRNLKQTSSVQEYQARFENLASMVEWTLKSLIAAFIRGLKEEIQIDIRAEKNEILRKCFAKACDIEERHRKKLALYKP